ncbi:MAG: GNAT family N-acetyltransferase [Actinobacteria bacterium]|nr:GNAT family N-acetyltransferase [Actinomycetota bacterium]
MLSQYWPLAGLAVRTPQLELRFPTEADLVALAELAAGGVHDPVRMPFLTPWTVGGTPAEIARRVLQYQWRCWGTWTPEAWALNLVTVVDGVVVGSQGLSARDFGALREVETGSWLGLSHQGRGVGTRMRAAIVHLAFAGLGAEYVTSSAFTDNPASQSVSRKVGYAEDGIARTLRGSEPAVLHRYRLSRSGWETERRDDIEIVGLPECRPLFGLT